MALTAAQICDLARQTAKTPGFEVQSGQFLNEALAGLCQKYDFATARGLYNFNFNASLQTNFGSGPYNLPADYLRTSGSSGSEGTQKSSWWVINGVRYPMIPVDLSEFDMQVQQSGMQSYPWLWATDMAVRRLVLSTSGNLHATTTVDNLSDVTGIAVGISVGGNGIVPGTTVAALSGHTVTLSQAALTSEQGASIQFAYPGQGYAYPPPSGNYPTTIRYQRQMPDIVSPEVSGVVPWYPDGEGLRTMVEEKLMALSDDTRVAQWRRFADEDTSKFLKLKDDDTNRAKTVQLDRRVFGSSFRRLKNTKTIGW